MCSSLAVSKHCMLAVEANNLVQQLLFHLVSNTDVLLVWNPESLNIVCKNDTLFYICLYKDGNIKYVFFFLISTSIQSP